MRHTDGFRPLSSVFDEWAAICISVAAVVYVLRTLPPLLAPSGLLGSFGCFIVGLTIGLSASVGLLVLLLVWVTEPDRHKHQGKNPQAAVEAAAKWAAQQRLKAGVKAIPTDCPLPSIRRRGHFKDCIFTVPGTQWDPAQAVEEWPPNHEGPKALASKWHAKLKGGVLVLKPDGAHPKANASVVRIPVTDCEVRVVSEGLRNKTRWWKKVPLELKHPSRTLLHGEKSVYIFAANGYAKEQLYLALQHAIQEGAPFLGVSQLYAAFCHGSKALEVVPFPRAKEITDEMETALQAASDPLPTNSKKRGWFRFGRGRGTQKSLAASSNSLRVSASGISTLSHTTLPESVLPEEPSSTKSMAARSVSPSKVPNGFPPGTREDGTIGPLPAMDPEELEKRWEGQYKYKGMELSFTQKDGGQISLQASTTTTDLEASYALLQTHTRDASDPSTKSNPTRQTPSSSDIPLFAGSSKETTINTIEISLDDAGFSRLVPSSSASNLAQPLPLPLSPTADPLPPSKAPHMFSPNSTPLSLMHGSASMPELSHMHTTVDNARPSSSPFRTSCSEYGGVPGAPRSEDGRSPEPSEKAQPRPEIKPPPSPTPSSAHPCPTPSPGNSMPLPGTEHSTHDGAETQKVAVEGVHGLNMMLNRLWFELLRSRKFEVAARNLVQRKLDDIRRPPYLHRLLVNSVDLGTSGPYVKHIAALPCPNNNIVWPQVLMEVCYSGSMSLTIGTKVELSKSKTWRGLERRLDSIRGSSDAAAAAAAAELRSEGSLVDQDIDEMTEALNAIPTEGLQEPGGASMREQAQGDQSGKNARRRWMGMLPGIRKVVADGIRNAVGAVSDSLAKIPFQIHVKLTRLEGTLLLWVPPPPSDRLWISFINTPKLDLTCKPSLGNRVLQSTTFLTRASSWLEGKLMRALTKSCVFPACNDIKLPWFADLEGLVEARGLHLHNMTQNQGQEWETASSEESEVGEEDQGSWLDNPIPLVSHPVTDLLDTAERAIHPKNQPSVTTPLAEPEPMHDSDPPSLATSMTEQSLRALSLTNSPVTPRSEAEARKQKKKENKGAKEAKRREAKEQRQEAKQRAKREKLLARELSATTAISTMSTASQALSSASSQGVKTAMLRRPWLFKRNTQTSTVRVSGLLRGSKSGEEDNSQYSGLDMDLEPRAQSMSVRASMERMLASDSAELRRSNSMSDLVDLKRRSSCLLAQSGPRQDGYNSDTTLKPTNLDAEGISFTSASYPSIPPTHDHIFNSLHTAFDARRASSVSLASTPSATTHTTPKGPSESSVPELIYTESPELGALRGNSSVRLPLPPAQISSSPAIDPLGGILVNNLQTSSSSQPEPSSPAPPATPPDQTPLPFITPPNSGELMPLGLSESHSAPVLFTMVGSPTESVYATPTGVVHCPIPDVDSNGMSDTHSTSPFATSGGPSMDPTQVSATPSQPVAGARPSVSRSNSRSWLGSAATTHLPASMLEASAPGIRRHDHSYSTGSLISLGGGSNQSVIGEGSHGSMTTVAGGQVVHRLKNMFGEVMTRRNDGSSEGGGTSRRSADTDPGSIQSGSSATMPQSGGSRFSNALTKMSSVASAAKGEIGKKLVQSSIVARLRESGNTEASPRHLTYPDKPSSQTAR